MTPDAGTAYATEASNDFENEPPLMEGIGCYFLREGALCLDRKM